MKYLAVSILSSLFSLGDARQEVIEGEKTTVQLPLSKQSTRTERMELTYWTSLLEPKECVRDPYRCDHKLYIPRFEGELSLTNVSITGWNDVYNLTTETDKVDMRLAFIQELDVIDAQMFTIGPTVNKPALP